MWEMKIAGVRDMSDEPSECDERSDRECERGEEPYVERKKRVPVT